MEGEMMTGNLAAAWGARLADVDYVPAFPITPQTEIVEALAKWCESGAMGYRAGSSICRTDQAGRSHPTYSNAGR